MSHFWNNLLDGANREGSIPTYYMQYKNAHTILTVKFNQHQVQIITVGFIFQCSLQKNLCVLTLVTKLCFLWEDRRIFSIAFHLESLFVKNDSLLCHQRCSKVAELFPIAKQNKSWISILFFLSCYFLSKDGIFNFKDEIPTSTPNQSDCLVLNSLQTIKQILRKNIE
jgi:hypothetical protein